MKFLGDKTVVAARDEERKLAVEIRGTLWGNGNFQIVITVVGTFFKT